VQVLPEEAMVRSGVLALQAALQPELVLSVVRALSQVILPVAVHTQGQDVFQAPPQAGAVRQEQT
jgi:hypothetical protein